MKNDLYSVAAIENGRVSLENAYGVILHLPISEVPAGTREGDVLLQTCRGFVYSERATAAAKAHTQELLEKLLAKK